MTLTADSTVYVATYECQCGIEYDSRGWIVGKREVQS